MAQTTPPTVDTLPTPPSTSDPANFNTRADAFLGALLTWATQVGALATNVYNNAVDCYNNAVLALGYQGGAETAQTAAEAAQAAAEATAEDVATLSDADLWVSGETVAAGKTRWSPADRMIYRRLISGAGTTDPSADAVNWAPAAPAPQVTAVPGTTVTAAKNAHYTLDNVAATTLTLPASPTVGDMVWVTVGNGLRTNVIARNGEPIMSLAEDLTLDDPYTTIGLRYINATLGWRIF